MVRFVVNQLRASWVRAGVLGAGLLIAGAGFVVLSSVSVSSAVTVRGTLNRNFQPAYDILVRPRRAQTSLERSQGLVNDGFLSDLYGGIGVAQWRRILRLPGVSVAAPVENIGYTLASAEVAVNLRPLIGRQAQQMFRVVPSFSVHGSLASYPDVDQYLFYSRDRWVERRGGYTPSLVISGHRRLKACGAYLYPHAAGSVFVSRADESMTCTGPDQRLHGGQRLALKPPGDDLVQLAFAEPVLVAAIDPVQEDKLVGLSRAMIHGSYLRVGEGISAPKFDAHQDPGTPRTAEDSIPLIASSRLFTDEALRIRVVRLHVPGGARLPERLVARGGGRYLDGLSGRTVIDHTIASPGLYRRVIGSRLYFINYWTTGAVRYRVRGRRTVAPIVVHNGTSVWEPVGSAMDQGGSAPTGADATQFRRLSPYDGSGATTPLPHGAVLDSIPSVRLQGTFDPARLRGFAPLSKVPLGTFFPPTVTGATRQARRLLHDRPLGPTTDIGGYLSQPPLFLTTLKAASIFFDSKVYTGNHRRRAPIAAIQVRVSGVHGASRASIGRVERVAGEIYRATHLEVDITAGSSPTPVRIDLAPGGFGQPALSVEQGWVKKGVATVVLNASDAKNSALFALVLLVAALFIANASFAAVRQRRSEIATLVTLGWERRQVFAAILGEVAIIGLTAGVAAAVLSAAVIGIDGLQFSLPRVVGVIPASVVIALLAGAIPAYRAARLSPMAALAAPVRTAAAARRVRSITRLAWVNLTRLPGRTMLGGFGLVLGVGALAFLLAIQHAFNGAVAGDVLGNHIDVEVHGADYVAVALILLLAVGSVADVLIMNLRERSGELATLQAFGWQNADLRRLVVTEGITIGTTGALLGALIGLLGAWTLGADPVKVLAGIGVAFAVGVIVCTTAVMPALTVLTRQMPATTLAPE